MPGRSWKTDLTRAETLRGWVLFLLYLFVLPLLNARAQKYFAGDGEVLVAEANVIYYVLVFLLVLASFWGFLRRDFQTLFDWLPENLFWVVAGLLGAGALRVLLSQLPFPVSDPILAQYLEEFRVAPVPTLALILVLIPLAEETLYRGLLLGRLRDYHRGAALAVCTILYALARVWRYALETGDARYLLLAVLYLPMSLALNLCYDRGGSVWAAVVLHGGINALVLLIALP